MQGKVAVAGLEDGHVALLDLRSSAVDPPKAYVQMSTSGKAVSALAVQKSGEGYRIAAGTVDGQISIYGLADANDQPRLIQSFKKNDADITSMAFSLTQEGRSSLLVGTSDGLPFQVSLASSSEAVPAVEVAAELAGYDIDACTSIKEVDGEIYAAGMDGHLRRY